MPKIVAAKDRAVASVDESSVVFQSVASDTSKLWARTVAVVFVVFHVGTLAWLAYVESPTWQEPAQVAAGLSWLSLGRSDMVRVSPPLVPGVAGLGALRLRPVLNPDEFDRPPQGRDEHARAQRLISDNPKIARRCFIFARLACIPFSLLGGYSCWRLSSALFGTFSGLTALMLWCSCPYILGHAAIVMTDVPAAAAGMATVFCFWSWLRSSDWSRAFVAGIMLGVAELTKFTLLVFYPLLPILWLAYSLPQWKAMSRGDWLRQGGILAVTLLVSVYVINCGYLFDGTFKPLGEYNFRTMMFTGGDSLGDVPPEGANRFAGTWLGRLPVPLPSNMLLGIDAQRFDFEHGFTSYLRGQWADGGWWYYYLYALTIKIPLGAWCLTALALGVTLFASGYSASWRDELVVLAPLFVILVFVSLETGFSRHSRYVIPAMPFLFVWTSKVARVFQMPPITRGHVAMTGMVILSLIWSVGSSVVVYPHSLSYFNELIGGPKGGPKHLLDSNIDWGQDLFYMKDWLDRHPDVTLNGLAYYGSFPAELAGIPRTRRPDPGPEYGRYKANQSADHLGPKPGWYALSVNYLYDSSRQYRHFLRFEPVAMAGYSIYIYHITRNEANRVRRELGLPELRGK